MSEEGHSVFNGEGLPGPHYTHLRYALAELNLTASFNVTVKNDII